jgi:hypothetical protein
MQKNAPLSDMCQIVQGHAIKISSWFQQVEICSSTVTLEDEQSTIQNFSRKPHRRHIENVRLWTLSGPLTNIRVTGG